ncbi:MAG: hypothetical protein LBM25_00860 [Bacteroidales bacterium]|jgi:uncharacterized membrane protein (DUF106 family)|nr:hypothetical protein [Bacteroidales bacterium]
MKLKHFSISNILNGKFLVGKRVLSLLPVIIVAVVLISIYINFRYSIERNIKEINKLEKEVEYLNKKHSEQKADYQKQTQMLELEKILIARGIKISKEEPKQVILIKKDTAQNISK